MSTTGPAWPRNTEPGGVFESITKEDPQVGFTGWEFRIRNGAAVPRNLRAYVICVPAKATPSNYTAGESAP